MKIKKENLVILVGFSLIIMVGLFTFIKPSFKDESKETNNDNVMPAKTFPRISPEELVTALRKNENPVIVDVRSQEDFNVEHIIDSFNIPAETISLQDNLDDTKPIIIIAEDSAVGDAAAKIFENKKFSQIRVLEDGFAGWKSSGGQVINWGDPTSFVNQSKVAFIDQPKIKKMIDEKRNIQIIDVRAKADYNEHLPGSINIPLDELEKRRSEIAVGREIVVYGATELEGFMAGVRLYDMNVLSCLVMREGFEKWKENNYIIEK